MNYNKTIIAGNIVNSIETSMTSNGLCIGKFSIAVNESYTNKEGEKIESVSFIEVTAFGKPAELIQKYTTKGDNILIDGKLKQDRWTAKEGTENAGTNYSKIGIILENFQFNGKKKIESENTSSRDEVPY